MEKELEKRKQAILMKIFIKSFSLYWFLLCIKFITIFY